MYICLLLKMPKIIDCFTFYNEIDMLKLRLEILYPVVDYFVLVEATRTFRGNIKPLYYEENKHIFEQYADKIIHVVDDGLSDSALNDDNIVWDNENHQRGYIRKGIHSLLTGRMISDDDCIVISDLDEIWNPEIVQQMVQLDFATLAMDMYYYNLETKCTELWSRAKMVKHGPFCSVFLEDSNWVRKTFSPNVIENAGWHLSYFGDVKFIQNKLANFGHQEYNMPEYTSSETIQNRIDSGCDLFGREDTQFQHIPIDQNTKLHPVLIGAHHNN